MQVEVLIFGGAAQAAHADRLTVAVDDTPTVRSVLLALHQQHPALQFAFPPPHAGRLAINHAFASGEHAIRPGDEVALITLVGGG